MWRRLRSPIRFCSSRSRVPAPWLLPVSQRRKRRPGRRLRRDSPLGRPSGRAHGGWVRVRAAENLKPRAEAQLAAAETTLGSAISAEAKEQAEGAKTQAVARIAE